MSVKDDGLIITVLVLLTVNVMGGLAVQFALKEIEKQRQIAAAQAVAA